MGMNGANWCNNGDMRRDASTDVITCDCSGLSKYGKQMERLSNLIMVVAYARVNGDDG